MAKGYGIDTEFKARGCSDRIVTSIHNGDYLKIRGVDFKNGVVFVQSTEIRRTQTHEK